MTRWRTTWFLLALAVVLFAFIVLVERRYWRRTGSEGEVLPRLASFKPTEVTNIQLRITNHLALRVERTNAASLWRLTAPFNYPAHLYKIEAVLQELAQIPTHTYIPPSELRSSKRNAAEFGLDLPSATLTLLHNGQRTEISFGNKTPTGDLVYVQVANQPGIYVVSADVFNRLPHSASAWRDTALFNLFGIGWNRIEMRGGSRSFAVDYDEASKTFILTKPTPARADTAKVEMLLRNLLAAQVKEFVNDNPRADGEQYGLQPPESELAFVQALPRGTNDQLVVQFGKSPTNDPSALYARRMMHTNVVLVPRPVLDTLPASASDLRDRRLVTFNPATVDSIEVVGTNNFMVRRQTNGTWAVVDAQPMAADPELMRDWLDLLAGLEGTVESDVVTDFKMLYNLAPPARQYLLRAAITNGTGVSNRVVAELDLGALQGDKVFARRPDEQSVYSLPASTVVRLPSAAWQLRPRRVWSFTSNQISRLIVTDRGQTNVFQRSPNSQWSIASGSNVIISNPVLFSSVVDELMSRLGELKAEAWIARGEESAATYGFIEPEKRITFELGNGEKPRLLTLEFGKRSPSGLLFARAVADGETWIFEFPRTSYILLVRDLFNPLFRDSQ